MIFKVLILLTVGLAACESAGLAAAPIVPYGHGLSPAISTYPAFSTYHASAIPPYHAPSIPATPTISAYHGPAISSYSPLISAYHSPLPLTSYHSGPIRAYAAPFPSYSSPYGFPYGHGSYGGRYAL